jgi:hypothetical protein
MKYLIDINLIKINNSEDRPEYFSKEMLKLNMLTEITFSEYKNN